MRIIFAALLPALMAACSQSSEPNRAANGSANREGNSVAFTLADHQTPSLHAAVTSGDPNAGSFGPLIPWPLVPIHAALTPDGRLMTFGRDPDAASQMIYDVWDWRLGGGDSSHLTLPNSLGTDLFCSNQLLLSNGEMLMAGGDIRDSQYPDQIGAQRLQGNRDANVFDPVSNQLSRRGRLTEPRWYASLTMLPWGEVYVQGGALDMNLDIAASHAEVASEDASQYRSLAGFTVDDLPWYYPRNFVDRHGAIVGWAHNSSYRIDPRGAGTRFDSGQAPGVILNNGSMAVMYAPGKILLAGGGSNHAVRADINGEVPAYESVPAMNSPRLWGTATVLPDGNVVVANGGTSDTSIVDAPLGEPAQQVKIYNPAENIWLPGATAAKPRLYHSTSILLPDATVLLGGGGLPGPVTNLNAELYYPPYLFTDTGDLAVRPVIRDAASVIAPASSITVNVESNAGVSRIVLVKTGAVTHSFDMDQRFVELAIRPMNGDGGTTITAITATLPVHPADTPPGFYHLFALDQQGVPSISKILRITPYSGELPEPPKPAIARAALGSPDGETQLLVCAIDERLVGLHGSFSEWIRTLGPICRSTDNNEAALTFRAQNSRPLATHTRFALECDSGHFTQGFRTKLSGDKTRLKGLQLECVSDSGALASSALLGQVDTDQIKISESCRSSSSIAGLTLFYDDAGARGLAMRCND